MTASGLSAIQRAMTQRKWSTRSQTAMRGIHPDLRAVLDRALADGREDFVVLEGKRSVTRQRKLVETGASKIMGSRHINGFAVDIAPLDGGKPSWHWPLYIKLAADMKAAAMALGVPMEWGGDWPHFKDGGHFELSRAKYPDPK